MRRVLALIVLWTLFAATGVAVGFAAARLVQEPQASPVRVVRPGPALQTPGSVAPDTATGPGGGAAPDSTSSTPTGTPGATASAPAPAAPQASTAAPAPTTSRSPGQSPGTASSTLGIETVAGYVSATCGSGVIRMSASPNRGWEVTELSAPGPVGRAEFEQTREPEGELNVDAWCDGGRPAFAVDDSELRPSARN